MLFGACASQRPAALGGPAGGPAGLLGAFVAALNHADIEAVTVLLHPDATAFLPVESAPTELVGRQAIRVALIPIFHDLHEQGSGPEYMHLVPKNVLIQTVGNLAIVTFDAGAGPVVSRRTLVVRNTADGWRILHFHGSNIRKSTTGTGAYLTG